MDDDYVLGDAVQREDCMADGLADVSSASTNVGHTASFLLPE